MEMPSTRILVIEDFKPYRSLINSLLARNPALRIIGEARDGLEAVTQARQLTPDMILMDIGLPKLNGIEVARRIRKLVPAAKIVFLTQETAVEIVHEALSLGAWGYIVKAEAETELLKGLAVILQGKRFVSSLAANGHGLS